jgi:hypothetical protein
MTRSFLINELEGRTKKGLSNFIIIIGKKGSGKSYLSLRLGEVIEGKSFGMRHVCFSINELFTLLDSGKYKAGDVIVLEEIGIAANSRDALTKTNKHLSFAAQAIRPARITLIANTISWGLMDSQVKNLADYRIEVVGHDTILQQTEFKFKKISPKQDNPEPYTEHLWTKDGEGRVVKHILWTMNRPSHEIAEQYDTKRMEYLKQIYADGAATMQHGEDIRFGVGKKKGRKPVITIQDGADKVLLSKNDYLIDDKLSTSLIQAKLNIDRHKARDIINVVKHRWKSIGGNTIV